MPSPIHTYQSSGNRVHAGQDERGLVRTRHSGMVATNLAQSNKGGLAVRGQLLQVGDEGRRSRMHAGDRRQTRRALIHQPFAVSHLCVALLVLRTSKP